MSKINLLLLLCDEEIFNKMSSCIQFNPNLLNFMSQNNRLVLKLLENPSLVDDMLAIPNICDPKYDLNVLFYQNTQFKDCIDYPPSYCINFDGSISGVWAASCYEQGAINLLKKKG